MRKRSFFIAQSRRFYRASLILASASPRRRQLLRKLKIPFRVIPSHVPETSAHQHPVRLVEQLALRKARAVARQLPRCQALLEPKVPGTFVVLGADTVVVLHRRIMSKPKDAGDACRMLGRLSGTTHQVYSGVALVDAASGRSVVSHARSDVRMKKIEPGDLSKLSRRHLDKAGSYAIQEKRDPIARVIKGSYDNVVGLPVRTVKTLLKRLSRGA
jgi:septum formation protein